MIKDSYKTTKNSPILFKMNICRISVKINVCWI